MDEELAAHGFNSKEVFTEEDALQMLKDLPEDGSEIGGDERRNGKKKMGKKNGGMRRRPPIRELQLLSGNRYDLDGNVVFQQPSAREDMAGLLEEAVEIANKLATERRKQARESPDDDLPPRHEPVTEAEARAVLKRSCVAATINKDLARAVVDYLRSMLNDAANSYM